MVAREKQRQTHKLGEREREREEREREIERDCQQEFLCTTDCAVFSTWAVGVSRCRSEATKRRAHEDACPPKSRKSPEGGMNVCRKSRRKHRRKGGTYLQLQLFSSHRAVFGISSAGTIRGTSKRCPPGRTRVLCPSKRRTLRRAEVAAADWKPRVSRR